MIRRAFVLSGVSLALALGAACVPTNAKTPGNDLPLAMPDAPVRVIVPVAIESPPPVDPPKPPATAPVQNAARPLTTATPPPVTPPAGATPPPEPAPILQTSANVTENERRVRTTMLKAQGDLGRIDYKRLNQDARAQYDQAKRFIGQAEGALKVKNFVYAEQLADKAASLAALLVKGFS